MSYIYLKCSNCGTSDAIYTGDANVDSFANREWEHTIIDTICDICAKGENK